MNAEVRYAVTAACGGTVCLACGLDLLFVLPSGRFTVLLAGAQVGLGFTTLAGLGGYYWREIRLTLVKTITKLRP